MKKSIIILIIILLAAVPLFAQFQGEIISLQSVGGGPVALLPLLDWTEHLVAGFGAEASLDLGVLPDLLPGFLYAGADLGFSINIPVAGGHLNSQTDIWAQALAGINLNFDDINLSLSPEFGYGLMLHLADGLISGKQQSSVFFDQLSFISLKIGYRIIPEMKIILQPEYKMFFETGTHGHQFVTIVGVEYKLGE